MIKIRTFDLLGDYSKVVKLWQSCAPGIQLRQSDEFEEIKKKCERDADLFLVAEENGKILGTLMGAFDGRRGMMYHLAVDKAYRHRGIAAELIDQFENRLRGKGCIRYYLLVVNDNDEAIRYYQKKGYEQLPVKTFAKNLI